MSRRPLSLACACALLLAACANDKPQALGTLEYDRITLPLFGSIAADDKPDGSSVTKADRDASAHVVAALERHTPRYGIISEEESEAHLPDAEWQ